LFLLHCSLLLEKGKGEGDKWKEKKGNRREKSFCEGGKQGERKKNLNKYE